MSVSWKRVSPPETTTPSRLRLARTCYDHLAGEIAVNIYQFMTDHGWFSADGSAITQEGRKQFLQLGISLDQKTSRKPCCACLDWSERRFHLGGYAGAAFLHHCEQHKWLTRTPGYREVYITQREKLAFQKHFNVFS